MSESVQKILEETISRGVPIKIVYNGGSQPGTQREIVPISIAGAKLRARDPRSGAMKTYVLDKISIGGSTDSAPSYVPGLVIKQDEPTEIGVFLSPHVAEFESLGWVVSIATNECGLFRTFKNGKLRKTPDIRLTYEPVVSELAYDLDKDDFVESTHASSRPYRLSSKSLDVAHTFTHLRSAANRLLELAKENAPLKTP